MLTYEDEVHFSQTKSWKRYFVRTNAAVLKFPILQHVGRAGVRFKVNCEMFWFDSQTMVCDGDIVSILLWIVGVHGLRDCGSSRSRGGYSPGSAFGRFRGWAGLEGVSNIKDLPVAGRCYSQPLVPNTTHSTVTSPLRSICLDHVYLFVFAFFLNVKNSKLALARKYCMLKDSNLEG